MFSLYVQSCELIFRTTVHVATSLPEAFEMPNLPCICNYKDFITIRQFIFQKMSPSFLLENASRFLKHLKYYEHGKMSLRIQIRQWFLHPPVQFERLEETTAISTSKDNYVRDKHGFLRLLVVWGSYSAPAKEARLPRLLWKTGVIQETY